MTGGRVSIFPLERAVAELLTGWDSGWTLWLGALTAIEQAVGESRRNGEMRFSNHPKHELERLVRELDDALTRAAFAADLRALMDAGEPASGTAIVTLLRERAMEIVAAQPRA